MRILALRPNGFVLPSIHTSLVKAFQSLEVEVLDLPVPNFSDHFRSFVENAQRGYQAVFTLDLGADRTFMLNIKDLQASLRIPWIIWFVDDPEGYGFSEICEPDWTLPFCWDQEIVQEKYSWSGMPMAYLPLATDPLVFFPAKTHSGFLYSGGVFVGSTAHPNEILHRVARTTPEFWEDVEAIWEAYRQDFRQSLHSLSWMRLVRKTSQPRNLIQADPLCRLWVQACVYEVGIRKRREVVSGVLGCAGSVYGDERWRDFVDKDLYRGWVAYGDELRKIYSESTFILDVRQPQARTGLTQRIFDASACGGAVLTEWSPELEVLFDPENELLSFHNLDEAIEMRERYLRDPRGAQKRGEKAMQRVLAHHTYRNRAARILQALQEFRG
ncbi:MAG: glycosyltransferase [Thermodesulfobacteriota bacterium]